MKGKQRNNGITLIALIITIIVLLILAGIVINLALGQNGIMVRGEEAGIEYDIAHEKEILGLALKDIQIQNGGSMIIPDEATLEKAMKDNSGMDGITAKKSSEKLYIVTYPDSKRQYEVYADGTVQDAAPRVNDDTPGEWEGDGTLENPYLIQSIEDLVSLSNKVSPKYSEVKAGTQLETYETYEGKYFKIQNDLNFASVNSYVDATRTDYGDVNDDGEAKTLIEEMTGGAGFRPIGNYYNGTDYSFKGNIDGNNHTISNLYIKNDNSNVKVGFIGTGDNVTITNLTLANAEIINDKNTYGTAILIGNKGAGDVVVSNCHVTGNITSYPGYVAPILGAHNYTYPIQGKIQISDTTTNSNIVAGGYYISELIACIYQTDTVEIKNCETNGTITGERISEIGGIIGKAEKCNTIVIESCKNNSEFKIENDGGKIGGIIGQAYSISTMQIDNSSNLKDMKLKSSEIGGIIGKYSEDCKTLTIANSYNIGNIEGTGNLGGIVGYYYPNSSNDAILIQHCYNLGQIKTCSNSGGYLGGIAGGIYYSKKANIEQCYNVGDVLGKGNYIGGIAGRSGDVTNIVNCYNTGDIEGSSYLGGIVGYINKTNLIENVYNTGDITSITNNNYLGGIVGYITDNSVTIKKAYNLGKIKTEKTGDIGAILGYTDSSSNTLENNYYLNDTYTRGIGCIEDAQGQVEMVETKEGMLTKLNELVTANSDIWQQNTDGKNEGYPTLK